MTAPSTGAGTRSGPTRFGPSRAALFPVLVLALGTLPLASTDPSFNALLLVPLACAVWVLRARVVVSTVGIEVCNGLAARAVPWPQAQGFGVPRRGPARLLRSGGRPLLLTALPRRQLPALRAAAQDLGRPPQA